VSDIVVPGSLQQQQQPQQQLQQQPQQQPQQQQSLQLHCHLQMRALLPFKWLCQLFLGLLDWALFAVLL